MYLLTEYLCDKILITYKKKRECGYQSSIIVDGGLANKVLGLTLRLGGLVARSTILFASLLFRWQPDGAF